ncbi:MAG: DUF1353 domain-containing protein [Pseudomonadota bacterium]
MSWPKYTPQIQDPYAAADWAEVFDFDFTSDLYIARPRQPIPNVKREHQYIVSAKYSCAMKIRYEDGRVEDHEILVPSGMLTDLTSVPSLARGLVGRVGKHLEAAIIHDFLFLAWQDMPGKEPTVDDFRFANEIMLKAMKEAKVGWVRRNAIYAAVSTFVARGVFFEKEPEDQPRYVRVPSPPAGYRTPEAA